MTLQSSGKITIGDIRNEFILMVSPPEKELTAYYGIVAGIPKEGLLKLSDFYGKSARITKNIYGENTSIDTNTLFTESERYSGAELEIVLNEGAVIGSNDVRVPALTLGNYNNSPKIILTNYGSIYGCAGGYGNNFGGTALKIFTKNTAINNQGNIFGGGGASGSGGIGGTGGTGYYESIGSLEGPIFDPKENDGLTTAFQLQTTLLTVNTIVWWRGVYVAQVEGEHVSEVNAGGYIYKRYTTTSTSGSGNGFSYINYPVGRQQYARTDTQGGSGGAGGNSLYGRGYRNIGGFLGPISGSAGSTGGINSGQGGTGGDSGIGGEWGKEGTSGLIGNIGQNGNISNGLSGQNGTVGGEGGYAVHLATLNEDTTRNIFWINQGNILGSIINSNYTNHT